MKNNSTEAQKNNYDDICDYLNTKLNDGIDLSILKYIEWCDIIVKNLVKKDIYYYGSRKDRAVKRFFEEVYPLAEMFKLLFKTSSPTLHVRYKISDNKEDAIIYDKANKNCNEQIQITIVPSVESLKNISPEEEFGHLLNKNAFQNSVMISSMARTQGGSSVGKASRIKGNPRFLSCFSIPKTDELDKLLTTNSAYIRCADKLFYAKKKNNAWDVKDLNHHNDQKRIQAFDKAIVMNPDINPRKLSGKELKDITDLTEYYEVDGNSWGVDEKEKLIVKAIKMSIEKKCKKEYNKNTSLLVMYEGEHLVPDEQGKVKNLLNDWFSSFSMNIFNAIYLIQRNSDFCFTLGNSHMQDSNHSIQSNENILKGVDNINIDYLENMKVSDAFFNEFNLISTEIRNCARQIQIHIEIGDAGHNVEKGHQIFWGWL